MSSDEHIKLKKIQCIECGATFRKKCKRVAMWEHWMVHEARSFYDMYLGPGQDGYITDGVYVQDMFEDYDLISLQNESDKFYGEDGKLLPQYGFGKCTRCEFGFWFEKADK